MAATSYAQPLLEPIHKDTSLLRIFTAGSVDDGKSTLIGRLLHDCQNILDDQLTALRKKSAAKGKTDEGDLEFSYLTDGLKAEQEQGITIDVAYRYFSTARRSFILADTPGHEQYTRNMATGASTADVAVILIDARHGVTNQTRRHAYIASLLGIRAFAVAVNKMDLIDYDKELFVRICDDFKRLAPHLPGTDLQFFPISALRGDNVARMSMQTPWYRRRSLLDYLETLELPASEGAGSLRFPVQYVIRPNQNFRGYAGTVSRGVLAVGDPVTILPSGRSTTIDQIHTFDGPVSQAGAGNAVTVTLAGEIDVGRGDLLVAPVDKPIRTQRFQANLVWMEDSSWTPGRSYLLKITSRTVRAWIESVEETTDVSDLSSRPASGLSLNEIARVWLKTSEPLFVDPYGNHWETGSFILIDPLSNATVACGMIRDANEMTGEKPDGLVHPNQGRASKAEIQSTPYGSDANPQSMVESPSRSIAKSVTWRLLATLTTTVLVFTFTGKMDIAVVIGSVEAFAKMLLYYFHERAWAQINYGRDIKISRDANSGKRRQFRNRHSAFTSMRR